MANTSNKLLIFGTGIVADILFNEYLDLDKNIILAFINSVSNEEKEKNGYPVITLNQVNDYNYDYILLAAGRYDRLYEQCIQFGINENKIIGIVSEGSEKLISVHEKTNKSIEQIFNFNIKKLFKKHLPIYFNSTIGLANELIFDSKINIFQQEECVDIQRSMALKTVVREIVNNNVPGNVAELGVYQGDFAKVINNLFPDKILYLFDTFGGFQQSDLEFDKEKNLSKANATPFKDTNVEFVLSKMPYQTNCKIIKGYFPLSAQGIEDNFSFVSIDADLFLPIYEGLKYFYPRLSHNGYIFVHDFNNAYFPGARKAVMEFCSNENIGYVPIMDRLL
jgi:hypothetical protein